MNASTTYDERPAHGVTTCPTLNTADVGSVIVKPANKPEVKRLVTKCCGRFICCPFVSAASGVIG
jgi:hypothetical protein